MVVNKPLVIKLSLAATKAVTEKIKSMIESSRIQVKKLIKLEDDYQGALVLVPYYDLQTSFP